MFRSPALSRFTPPHILVPAVLGRDLQSASSSPWLSTQPASIASLASPRATPSSSGTARPARPPSARTVADLVGPDLETMPAGFAACDQAQQSLALGINAPVLHAGAPYATGCVP